MATLYLLTTHTQIVQQANDKDCGTRFKHTTRIFRLPHAMITPTSTPRLKFTLVAIRAHVALFPRIIGKSTTGAGVECQNFADDRSCGDENKASVSWYGSAANGNHQRTYYVYVTGLDGATGFVTTTFTDLDATSSDNVTFNYSVFS